jgi:hypothetical protein
MKGCSGDGLGPELLAEHFGQFSDGELLEKLEALYCMVIGCNSWIRRRLND